eukprot:1140688-Pelagomonas_calceolata.AAC.2
MPSGNKLVGIRSTMGMEYASKFNGILVVKSQMGLHAAVERGGKRWKEGGFGGCAAPNCHHFLRLCVICGCSPRAFTKSFDDHSSGNIVAFSFHAGNDIMLAA